MPEYPDNSHSARENTSPPSKRVEKVVNGTAKTRKQSEVKKFAGIFMPDEVGDVKTFIITDVVIQMSSFTTCLSGSSAAKRNLRATTASLAKPIMSLTLMFTTSARKNRA